MPMFKSADADVAVKFILCLLMISIPLGFAWGSAYYEAQAYYRVTGKKVSTWDAIFLDLRVQEGVK